MRHVAFNSFAVILLAGVYSSWTSGQTLKLRPSERQSPAEAIPPNPLTMPMTVPAGTPIKVALDSEVRIQRVGQTIHGKTAEPVYEFDKLLIPAGTAVTGKIAAIDDVSKKIRTLDAMNANFSPLRNVHVQFDELVLADGRHVAMKTVASPAPNGVLQFVSANEREKKKSKVGDAASRKVSETRQEIRRQWDEMKNQLHEPGKMHKLKRLAQAQLPVHPQYIDAGTSFNADLMDPLDFGSEVVRPGALANIGAPPPSGSMVHARLVTPLNSATTKKGEPVEALITEPLVVSDRLILPEGSVIKGSVVQVRPARRLARNGQLRILFHEVAPPNGIEQKVEASLEGVAVAKGEHLKLDAEGGAQVTAPRTRYLTTGIQVMLAATSASPDRDAGEAGQSVGEAGRGAANGASGFRFVGALVAVLAHSRVVSAGFGAYGAASSIYYHFLARGRDVVYPKDMAMVVGLGTREGKPKQQEPAAAPISQLPVESEPSVARGN